MRDISTDMDRPTITDITAELMLDKSLPLMAKGVLNGGSDLFLWGPSERAPYELVMSDHYGAVQVVETRGHGSRAHEQYIEGRTIASLPNTSIVDGILVREGSERDPELEWGISVPYVLFSAGLVDDAIGGDSGLERELFRKSVKRPMSKMPPWGRLEKSDSILKFVTHPRLDGKQTAYALAIPARRLLGEDVFEPLRTATTRRARQGDMDLDFRYGQL